MVSSWRQKVEWYLPEAGEEVGESGSMGRGSVRDARKFWRWVVGMTVQHYERL